ncbi:hypothetical protein HanXRQr2_Chr06g0277691 [Helianthus annuus]|uniref:Uncharacterized protein n=1 Tax=Helianthus annuus TaxID=4232 RepID=A0A9K3IVX6_HELAN|nr:hypothetical protein HanXRQr2_Chr06g0277691 [Helianthus annuus]KAJ0917031.1 hypothetical protein HanPSC8_Chr06g0268661 [Helianthus annuus]
MRKPMWVSAHIPCTHIYTHAHYRVLVFTTFATKSTHILSLDRNPRQPTLSSLEVSCNRIIPRAHPRIG